MLSSLRFFNPFSSWFPISNPRSFNNETTLYYKNARSRFPNFYIKLHLTSHNRTMFNLHLTKHPILKISLQSTLPIDLFRIFPRVLYTNPSIQHLGRRCHDLEFKVQAWTSCNRFHRLFVAQEWCKPGFQRVYTL